MRLWDETEVDVLDDIVLDSRNVRLGLGVDAPQSDLLAELFDNEKALDLVVGISKVGLLEHELPVVVYRNGALTVVEGNRRVAALKAIQNPLLVPAFQARIDRAVANIPDRAALRMIRVKVAPSDEDAEQLIAALHTGEQRHPWTAARRAQFFQTKVDEGRTLAQLIASYPTIDVKDYVRSAQLMKLFRSASFSDPELRDYVAARKFPINVFARLFDNADFLNLARIDVDPLTAVATAKPPVDRFSALVEKVVRDIKSKKITTRVLDRQGSQSYLQYMDELKDLTSQFPDRQPEPSRDPGGKAGTRPPGPNPIPIPTPTPTPPSPVPTPPSPPKSPTGKLPIRLNTTNMAVPATYPTAFATTFAELADINYRRFPAATMDLLRTVLEKAIKAYFESKGVDVKAELGKKSKPVPNFVQLGHCLDVLHDIMHRQGNNGLVQTIRKIKSPSIKSWAESADHLNAVNHNPHITASSQDVEAMWNQLSSVIRFVLQP